MLITNLAGSRSSKKHTKQIKRNLIILLAILIVSISSFLIINMLKKDKTDKNNIAVAQDENASAPTENEMKVAKVTDELKKIYNITDENLTVVTITDVEKLKLTEPNFYKDAKNGDFIVILDTEKLAILFRLEEKRIIKISPVKIDI
jgi:hypothetical protein